jgi:hypothetical protein
MRISEPVMNRDASLPRNTTAPYVIYEYILLKAINVLLRTARSSGSPICRRQGIKLAQLGNSTLEYVPDPWVLATPMFSRKHQLSLQTILMPLYPAYLELLVVCQDCFC